MKWAFQFIILISSSLALGFNLQEFECSSTKSRPKEDCPFFICKSPNGSQALASTIGGELNKKWIQILPISGGANQKPVLGEIRLAFLRPDKKLQKSDIQPSFPAPTGVFPGEYKDSFITYQLLSEKKYTYSRDENLARSCDDPELTTLVRKIDEHKDHLYNVLKNRDYVKIIDVINGSNVISRMVPRSQAQGYCQLGASSYASLAAVAMIENTQLKEPRGKILTEDEAKKLFAEIKAMKDIPWEYTPDGCYARAQIAAERIEKKGIAVGKTWYFGDSLWPKNKELGDLDGWGHHVAPFIYVKGSDGKIRRMALDPATEDGPVEVFEFGRSLTRKEGVQVIQTRWAGGAKQTGLPYVQMILTNVDYYDPSIIQSTPRRSNTEDAIRTNNRFNETLMRGQTQN